MQAFSLRNFYEFLSAYTVVEQCAVFEIHVIQTRFFKM